MSNFKNLTVYVSNFNSKKMSEELLMELFNQVEPVQSLSLKGEYAFVNFKDEESVAHVCREIDGIKIFDLPLNVKPKARSKIERLEESRKRRRSSPRDERREDSREYKRVESRAYKMDNSRSYKEEDAHERQKRYRKEILSDDSREYRGRAVEYERNDLYYPEIKYMKHDAYQDDRYHRPREYKTERVFTNRRKYEDDDEYHDKKYFSGERYVKEGRNYAVHGRGLSRDPSDDKMYKRHDIRDNHYGARHELRSNKIYDRSQYHREEVPLQKSESRVIYSEKRNKAVLREEADMSYHMDLKEKFYKIIAQYSRGLSSNNRYTKDDIYDRNKDKYDRKVPSQRYERKSSSQRYEKKASSQRYEKKTEILESEYDRMLFLKPKFDEIKIVKKNDYTVTKHDQVTTRDKNSDDDEHNNNKIEKKDIPVRKSNKYTKEENNLEEINTKNIKRKYINMKFEDDLEEGEMTS